MNSVQQQCQAKLELERDNIVEYLRPSNNADKSPALDPNEQQLAWQMELKLRSVYRALQRLTEERFGICQDCRRPIGDERLLALPSAELCIDCQRWRERTTGRHYRPSRLSSVAL
jgi:RNA polymerase-binding transcription factor DksA